MKKVFQVFAVAVLSFVFAVAAQADEYILDTGHSSINFAVTHLMVSETKGGFTDYRGIVKYDPADVSKTEVDVTIQVASLNTHLEARDNHLRSADFLDAEKFATITFRTTMAKKEDDGTVTLVGDLTLHGVTIKVSIPVKITGPVKSPMGGEVIGLSGEFIVNRSEFGVAWNKDMEGGVVVGNDVKVSINAEAKKQ